MINPIEFKELRNEFNKIDTDHSGTIEVSELRAAVRKCHQELSEQELERIVKEVDLQGNGVINYHDFIAATFNVDKYANQQRLESLF